MDLFNFIISDRMRQHGQCTLNLEVLVKTNNITSFKKDLMSALEIFIQKENEIFTLCNFLQKSNFHRQTRQVEESADKLLFLLDLIKKKSEAVFYEDRSVFASKFETLISYLEDGKITFGLDKLGTMLEDFSAWLKETLAKKIDMCEKLAQLDKKPLKALVKFVPGSFETHFTRYHLNLEHFSDLMHKLLQAELSEQYVAPYQVLESEHFQLMAGLAESEVGKLKVETFLATADELMLNHKKIDQIHKMMVQAQVRGEEIKENIKFVTSMIYQISKKFDEMYSFLLKKKAPGNELRENFAKMIGIFSQIAIKDFLVKKEIEIVRFYDWLLNKENVKVHLPESNKMLFSNLEKIEPEIAKRIKSKVIAELKAKEEGIVLDTEGQYIIRKNSKGIFDRHNFYTHMLINFEFIPKSLDNLKNRYLSTSGIDKILMDRTTLRFSQQVFSPFLNREIVCDLFLEVSYYHINISNFYYSKSA